MPLPTFENVIPNTPFQEQMGAGAAGPVVLLNTFVVADESAEAMLECWREDALIMKQAPGFISTQLHRAVGAPGVFVNYAVFESMAAYRAAFANPAFRAAIEKTPEGAVMRVVLLEKVAVPNLCVA